MTEITREIKTVMHPLKIRSLKVSQIDFVSPKIKRITLVGPELADFVSASPDDHIKVFFPLPGEETAVIPVLGEKGLEFPKGREPIMRDYTPRRFNAFKNELEIDFVLHESGPGSDWAKNAKIGDVLTIGGPRGSRIVPYSFDWYLMIGDETAIPSIARRLEEFPQGVQAVAIIEVDSEADQIQFESKGSVALHWVFRKGVPAGQFNGLRETVMGVPIPSGDYFAWVSTEKAQALEIKDLLLNIKGAKEEWIKATGYWNRAKGQIDS